MNSRQSEFPALMPESPEAALREILSRAVIRHRGDIRAYFAKLLENVPTPAPHTEWLDLSELASQRQRRIR